MNISECINNIERQYPVSAWKVGDIEVWPLVRIGLVQENFISPYKTKRGLSRFSRLVNEIRLLFLSLYFTITDGAHNVSVEKADAIFLGNNISRTVKLSSGEMACQNLDMIRNEFKERGFNYYSIELLSGFNMNFPRYTKSDLLISWKLLKIRFATKFTKNSISCELPNINEVKEYLIQNGFKCSICDESPIIHVAKSIEAYSKFFIEILEKVQAKLGVVVCWYSNLGMSFAHACRKKQIPCVDIQHGVAGGCNHDAYAGWKAVPLGGYNIMPTNFWCWSTEDALAINKWFHTANSSDGAFVGGNKTQMYLLKKDAGNVWHNIISKKIQNGKKRILLTLQNGFMLPEWLIEYIISTSETIQWFVRLHPMVDDYQQIFIDKIKDKMNVEYEITSKCPLGSVLEICQMHITLHSSVVKDAELYGVKSIILNELAIFYFKDSINKGNCFFAKDIVELSGIINRELHDFKDSNNIVVRDDSAFGIEQLIKLIQN